MVRDEDYKNDWNLLKTQNLHDLDSLSSYDSAYVLRQVLITSSSRKSSRDIGMLRNTREDLSILGDIIGESENRRN